MSLSSDTPHARLRTTGIVALVIMMIGAVAAATVFVQKAHQAKAATSWTTVFDDEFSGSGGLNTSNWKYDTGTGWGTGEVENMTSSTSNIHQANGYLYITAINSGGSWTSGRFESQQTFRPSSGIMAFESRIMLPSQTGSAAQGYWPAFWSLGGNYRNGVSWPTSGEVDAMESVNGTNVEYGTFHCGACNEPNGIGGSTTPNPAMQGNFHTYRVEYDYSASPQQIRWYLDGNQFFSVNANQFSSSVWSSAFNAGFFIMYDFAIGGNWPGNPTGSTASGANMVIDYARVYYSASSSSPTATPTKTGGSTATPTPTASSGSGFSQSVASASSTTANFTFTPSGWTAGYVILHYTIPGQSQQNVYMTSSGSSWIYTASGFSPGSTVTYSFTYQKSGLQYDTGSYTWTHP
jgi:beta-glucanase (GH16 family)